jgi:hypothetical protein
MLHTGRHQLDEIPFTATHIHTDPFSEHALSKRTFDLTIAACGRLRRIAQNLVGRPGE